MSATITTRTWLKVGLVYPIPLAVLYFYLLTRTNDDVNEIALLVFGVFLIPYVIIALRTYWCNRNKIRPHLTRLFWMLPIYVSVVYSVGMAIIVLATLGFWAADRYPFSMSQILRGGTIIGGTLIFSAAIAWGISALFSTLYWVITWSLEHSRMLRIVSPAMDTPLSAPADTTHSQ